ncbi:MAG: glutamate--tRNA ligase [Candidatus Vogelbacteria bacterium CG10_big_fil_rev_8_21_14_0_10_45_14]|uniref:Glutamate--tRNA ligase n=1 Tax=Candidatus Vogelbacteria bacterium CG10_big_fil_rev_8_21_14_0_10_45_14 TaxID=1975042 RepID=A0A2H0RKB6_9BACT|nr:MAG: glutamate--tRNA ligase [Candidatus Vogelbacteria bacterium CG10_big_fil_rev_8_21_14_0_10_45_14]
MQENTVKKVVTRFAPSPTGFMHVGGVRTALFAYLMAKRHAGVFILRIEDTDKKREVEGSLEHIMESLRWLGIEWDEGPNRAGPHGPYIQSMRTHSYRKYAQILVEKGFAYPDPYSIEELENFREQALVQKKPFLYREYRPETFATWDGVSTLRFKTPEIKRYDWYDVTRGELSAGPEALDDFILMKSDGYPTYNFAHIVDDLEMEVSHVVRGEEFISSMPKFLSLYDALGIVPPVFITMPPILGKERTKKLSKRDGAKDILDYRKEGYLPSAMVNFLATLGWSPTGAGGVASDEILNMSELISRFDATKIQKTGSVWNDDKLLWMNKAHMTRLPKDALLDAFRDRLKGVAMDISPLKLERVLPLVLERISVWNELDEMIMKGELEWVFSAPSPTLSLLGNTEHLHKVADLLSQIDENDWNIQAIKGAVFDFATKTGRKDVLAPMRVALSGLPQSPDPFSMAYVLGKVETLSRLMFASEVKI